MWLTSQHEALPLPLNDAHILQKEAGLMSGMRAQAISTSVL
jgi:hypothetical protein